MQTELYGRIYKLTNKINGKPYIGQTIKNINKRWDAYKRLDCKGQPKLYKALKKYGPQNFLFEIIDTSARDQKTLDNLEIKYIAEFNSIKNGYNCLPGGIGGWLGGKHSKETKEKMSQTKIINGILRQLAKPIEPQLIKIPKKRIVSWETRQKMVETAKSKRLSRFESRYNWLPQESESYLNLRVSNLHQSKQKGHPYF